MSGAATRNGIGAVALAGAIAVLIAILQESEAVALLCALFAALILAAIILFAWPWLKIWRWPLPWPSRWRHRAQDRQDRIEAVAAGLRGLLIELGQLCEELEGTGREEPLKGWKRRAKRFLDANLASDKVTPFDALATERPDHEGGQLREHIRSSCAAHRRFLRELQEDVVAGYEPVTKEEAPSGRGIPPTKSFIWRPDDGR